MLLLNNEVDISKSFEKLKAAIAEGDKIDKADRFGYMQAYVNLSTAVERHIKECTGEPVNEPAANIDDLKDIELR